MKYRSVQILGCGLLGVVFVFVSTPRAFADEVSSVLKLEKKYSEMVQKPWKAKPGYDVVLATSKKDDDGKVVVAVIKTAGKLATVVANEKIALDEDCAKADPDSSNATTCTEIALDLAPYRLNETDTAIGVRWNQHQVYPAGESDDKQISLLQLNDGKLKAVLSTDMNSQAEERGPNEMIETKCTLAIEKTKTKAYFDIQKHCVITVAPLVEPEAGEPAQATRKHTQNTLFQWNGTKYVEKGAKK